MIIKYFYDEEDYKVIMKLLSKIYVSDEDIERVKTRQLFIMGIENKK